MWEVPTGRPSSQISHWYYKTEVSHALLLFGEFCFYVFAKFNFLRNNYVLSIGKLQWIKPDLQLFPKRVYILMQGQTIINKVTNTVINGLHL